MDLCDKVNELKPILEGCPHILYMANREEDGDAFGSAGCDTGDAILCIKYIVKRFNLDPLAMAIAVDVSLAINARQN